MKAGFSVGSNAEMSQLYFIKLTTYDKDVKFEMKPCLPIEKHCPQHMRLMPSKLAFH